MRYTPVLFGKFRLRIGWSPRYFSSFDLCQDISASAIRPCNVCLNVKRQTPRRPATRTISHPNHWVHRSFQSKSQSAKAPVASDLITSSDTLSTAVEQVAKTVRTDVDRDGHVFAKCENIPHVPVLLQEVLSAFSEGPVVNFLDGTLGAGGHSSAVLSAHPELRHLVALDVDSSAHLLAAPRLEAAVATNAPLCRVHLVEANFESLDSVLGREEGLPQALDGILLDLGVSSMQLDQAGRGFSFMRDGPLDMRMNPQSPLTAEQIVNSWEEAELGRILKEYGEERRWRQIGQRIVTARMQEPITTTFQLLPLIGGGTSFAARRAGGKTLHPATRTFQALRIAVNDELGALERGLAASIARLAPGGRLAVISFHSLEDRIVKRAFLAAANSVDQEEAEGLEYIHIPGRTRYSKYRKKKGLELERGADEVAEEPRALSGFVVLTKRPIVAQEEETRSNPRSRSAKLRILQRF